MKVLLCHAYYAQRGGEDQSFEEERALLRANGHSVVEYVRTNEDMNSLGRLAAAATTLWNRRTVRELSALIDRERPDVVHATNTFPLISPAACHAAYRRGAAVVQALRNYRLLCAGAYLLRDGQPCEDCLGRAVPWPAIRHRCYRDSAAASAAVASMQVLHRALGTWRRCVDAFFTLTDFARQKFVDAGFPAERIHVKHNSVLPDPGVGGGAGGYVAFAGRLSPEKGVATLLDAWRLDARLPRLVIVGDGPLADSVRAVVEHDARIELRGHLPLGEVHALFQQALAVIMPSLWYETFGRTIAEAFACGTPVVASRLGAMAELVDEPLTGRLFAAGDAVQLAEAVHSLQALPAAESGALRQRARGAYDRRFTPQHNYRRLIEIYELAQRERARRGSMAISNKPQAALVMGG